MVLIATSLPPIAHAQSEATFVSAERPNAQDGPTVVKIGYFLIDVDSIDDVEQRFSADIFVTMEWQDPRLALADAQRNGAKRLMSRESIWRPKLLIVNERGLSAVLPDVVEVGDNGEVLYQQRFYGQFSNNMQFREFPFDVQNIAIEIISYANESSDLQLVPNTGKIGRSENFSVEGWDLEVLPPDTTDYYIATRDLSLPRYAITITAERNTRYYLLTMMLPMSLIIVMSWMVFWLPAAAVPQRIAISTAAIFSLIALGFSIRLGLPEVAYMTRADTFVLGSTLMVFLALIVAVTGSRWAVSERETDAVRLSLIARWSYPVLFALVMLVALLR